ncbi:hypothetical protein HHK36_033442 [Tetracentron sinense]|uniref:Ubiquitin-like domain-containing protein n=1 Tax=Tetracentron sinense TaxID=13715 RepID=A0A834Y3K3_TETSI|nr:hypothetical protein HHK36_033442 [Tetracentron sinense]
MSGTTAAPEEEKKPMDQSAHINLKVKGQFQADHRIHTVSLVTGDAGYFEFTNQFHRPGKDLSPISVKMIRSACFPVALMLVLKQIEDGNEVFFRIKRVTQLRKLMTAYCDRQSVEFNSIAFLFDGRRLRGEQTPDELEMEDGDEIDAMLHQTGGGCACL